jgi:hypothetical protein
MRVFSAEENEYRRTGAYSDDATLNIANLQFTVRDKGSPYPLFEKEQFAAYCFRGSPLPLKRLTTRYYELIAETVRRDFETERARLIAEADAEAVLKVPENAVILGKKTSIRPAENRTVISVDIETELRVSV